MIARSAAKGSMGACLSVLICASAGVLGAWATAGAGDAAMPDTAAPSASTGSTATPDTPMPNAPMTGTAMPGTAAPNASPGAMAGMSGHMYLTTLRSKQPGDQVKADAVVAAAKQAMEPYQDYRKALADGYEIFLPDVPQSQYHFTKNAYGLEARTHFDPSKPTSLLYKKTADGGYELVGAMYTDRVDASEEEINERIPLSIARWHQHINFCKAPAGHKAEYFGPDAKYGLLGSITTPEACEAAGGTFYPHFFGWMVHVYPYEKDPKNVWSTMDDEAGHDNMDHSAMAGMKSN